ncbi:hypothetical protein R6Q59_018937 [Mikania micrantha]|uniref:DUF4408 domain-containing protein n=1 Tax=Mikania micrantha TaxID=192012 RepID=A0A5N6LZW4_9ASTR|nr:hypothetical protein E3N88_34756 [Mikania micrantha]
MASSLKIAVISTTIVSTAIMFKILSPFIMSLTISDLPVIWNSIISWLEPPYLYVVINGIIITIFASSRLQFKIGGSDTDHLPATFPTPKSTYELVKVVLPVELPPVHEPQVPFPEPVDIPVDCYNSGSNSKLVEIQEPEFNTQELNDESLDLDMQLAKQAYEEIKKHKADKSLISLSAFTSSENPSFPVEKPPASTRFSHRKPAKVTPEGGKTLGVAKPKRQDTLETTWKTITEGRAVPLTRHLRKSDTWETHGPRRENRNSDEFSTDNYSERMTKSETFGVTHGGYGSRKPVKRPTVPSKLLRSGGSGGLKKEPSLGQEELNRRVEAFIKKFNEDMRLQRQESLNRFMEMINRGAH